MKKIILSSILFSSLVFSEQIRIIPIDKSYLAQENGGSKSAIDAYSDGVGIVTESKQIIDNSPMNTLVFTYGEKAKNNSSSLKNYSIENGSNEEKDLANKLGKVGELNNNIEGTYCNDNNIQTINDKYVNGICVGTNVEGQSCDDENSQTINDIYVNGICVGENKHLDIVRRYTWEELNNLSTQSKKSFITASGGYGSTKTGGIFDTINTNYTSGFYFSKHIENESYGNTTGVLSSLEFELYEKGRIWAGQWTGDWSNYYYDSDIDLFMYKNGIWTYSTNLLKSVYGKKEGGKFTIASEWLEPGKYKIQRKENVYSSAYPTTLAYEGLRSDSEWFIEKY